MPARDYFVWNACSGRLGCDPMPKLVGYANLKGFLWLSFSPDRANPETAPWFPLTPRKSLTDPCVAQSTSKGIVPSWRWKKVAEGNKQAFGELLSRPIPAIDRP
jgi:hypothetical protein